jgi:hypothetical protein
VARQRSKADYGLDVFRAEPPSDDRTAIRLLVGREDVVERAYQGLRRHLDIGGLTTKPTGKHPAIIQGETRSGKSHLAKCLFARFRESDKRLRIEVPARNRGDALAVIRAIFERLRDEFYGYFNGELAGDVVGEQFMQLTATIVGGFDFFWGPGGMTADSMKLTTNWERADTVANEAAVFRLAAKFQNTSKSGGGTELTLRPPSALLLAEACGVIVDALNRAGLLDHVLVLVDDVDLVARYNSPQDNGRVSQSELATALCELHRSPCVDVVVTARSWYANSQKEFTPLVNLAAEPPLTPAQLAEIHDRRMALAIGKRALPRVFLAPEALEEAAAYASCLPGVFLQHLDASFDQWRREEDWGQRSAEWYLGVFRDLWNRYRQFAPAAAERLAQSVNAGKFTLDVEDENLLAGTVFDNEFAFQSYFNETTYIIPPLVRAIVRSVGAPE